jgi:acetylornithine deacetylase
MDSSFAATWDAELREFVARLVSFESTEGREGDAQAWVRERLDEFGFETYEWLADAERLAGHPSFPDDPAAIPVEHRPSVAGVLEFGDPDAGRTLVLNGHVDVVPATRSAWATDPFEPSWSEDGERLTARGAADMKAGLAACIFAARHLAEAGESEALDGRVVVESVAGEEDGGIGAAAAALDSPYPFERDGAVVAEPTELKPVTAVEGSVMMELGIEGRSAHAATRWRGESVLPQFERIRRAFEDLEAERCERVTHPLYEAFPVPWPVVCGRVEAGNWTSTVPAELRSEWRIGVAPGETVDEVEAEYRERLDEVVAESDWLSEHPPSFERFSVQFEPATVDHDAPVVGALQAAMRDAGLDAAPTGATYGADNRHYQAVGVPTVVFGPGTIDQAHYPDETIEWPAVLTAGGVLAETARAFLAGGDDR